MSDELLKHEYRKKPVVVEAKQYTGDNAHEILHFAHAWGDARTPVKHNITHQQIEIETLEGLMIATVNDWIIRGVSGEFYPCKPDIFEATYTKEPTDDRVSKLVELVNQVLAAAQKLDAAIDTALSDADLEIHYTHFAKAASQLHLLTYDGGPLTKALEAL